MGVGKQVAQEVNFRIKFLKTTALAEIKEILKLKPEQPSC